MSQPFVYTAVVSVGPNLGHRSYRHVHIAMTAIFHFQIVCFSHLTSKCPSCQGRSIIVGTECLRSSVARNEDINVHGSSVVTTTLEGELFLIKCSNSVRSYNSRLLSFPTECSTVVRACPSQWSTVVATVYSLKWHTLNVWIS